MSTPFDLATVEAPYFEPLVGQKFLARPADGAVLPPTELELLTVQPFHHRAETGGRAPFALLFKSGAPIPPAQGNYELSASGLEPVSIFLVPVRDPLRGLCVEAVFN